MIDFRPIMLVTGILLCMLGLAMLLPAVVDLSFGNADWQIFAASAVVTTVSGAIMYLTSRNDSAQLNRREAFLMAVSVWVVLCIFGALPLYWSGVTPSYTDAFFESISALTTTGATVISGLDHLPPGMNLWRGILQWLGGLGIIVMAVSILPMLQIGGMQVFKAEAFDTAEKILPSATQISGILTGVYTFLTVLCAILYFLAGMSISDAVIHAMTTVATGGMSTKDGSIGHFDSAAIDTVAISFMILGSLPFLLYVKMMQSGAHEIWRDSQVRVFVMFIAVASTIVIAIQLFYEYEEGIAAIRHGMFNVISIMTGTGYATRDYYAWGPLSSSVFLLLMFIGGCAGSTSCGMKIFRWQVLYENLKQHVNRIVFPNGVFVMKFNGKRLDDSVSSAVLGFFFLYILSFGVLSIALAFTGLDTITAISGAATAISNVGPGLGDIIGPNGNFEPLNDVAKWLLSFGMLLGRLELLTVLVLFSPAFWRG